MESLGEKAKRKVVIDDCVTMIDEEVGSKGGLSGIAIKAAYKVVKGLKPGFIAEAVDGLLDDFCKNLQPIADEAVGKGLGIQKYFVDNRGKVADALLSITDERAKKTRHNVAKGAYEKLRGTAKKNVEEAVPRIGAVIEKHSK
jgi:hypothetical protein